MFLSGLFSQKGKADLGVSKNRTIFEELTFNISIFSFVKAIDVALASQGLDISSISTNIVKSIDIKQNVNLSSKFFDIQAVEGLLDRSVEVFANIQTIAGIEGNLPDCYVEKYITHNKDSKDSVVDFLDILYNRVVSLRYIFMKRHDVTCLSVGLEKSLIGNIIFSLSGFDFFAKDEKSASLIPQQLKISAHNLFWKSSRSGDGLRILLSSFFDVPVKVSQFIGGFEMAGQAYQTKIGKERFRFNKLGIDSFLGDKSWNAMQGIDIFIGPLDFKKYTHFLPKMSKYDEKVSPLQKMKEVVKMYVPCNINVKLHFYLDKCEVRETILNSINRLNKDSFILGQYNMDTVHFTESI